MEEKAIATDPLSGVGMGDDVGEAMGVGVRVGVGVKVGGDVGLFVGGEVEVGVGGTGVVLLQEAIMIRQTTPTINHISLCAEAGIFIMPLGLAKVVNLSSFR